MIYTSFVIRVNDTSICFSFLKENEAFEENNNISSRIFDIFSLILFKDNKHHLESSCLIDNMIEQNLINNNFVKNKKISYIVQKLTLGTDSFIFKGITFKYNEYVIYRNLIENFNQLSKNNWELHNNLIKEGVNPNEIAKIIRNDEIGKLQEISSQANFNFNQTIEPSFYERCSFIIQINVTLIDYAAFFGSIKCFKYLLVNGATLENTGKYAVAGGNEEIFYLCLQNHSSFKDVYETAIKFHKNDIFKYIYENKIIENCDLEDLGKKCIHHHNFDLFLYLQEEGMKINNVIINEAAKDGNIFIVEYFLELNQIPSDILVFSSESENIELVRYILDQGKINVNTKNIYIFSLKYI